VDAGSPRTRSTSKREAIRAARVEDKRAQVEMLKHLLDAYACIPPGRKGSVHRAQIQRQINAELRVLRKLK